MLTVDQHKRVEWTELFKAFGVDKKTAYEEVKKETTSKPKKASKPVV